MPAARHPLDSSLPVPALTALWACLALSLGGCDGDDPPLVEPEPPRVTSIVITPSSLSFDALGDTARLSASVKDQYGESMPGVSILWVSGEPTIASVDQTGLVESIRDGKTTVRAQAGLRRDTIHVQVLQEPHSLSIEAGDNQSHWTRYVLRDTLRVRVEDRAGNPMAARRVGWEVMVGGGEVQFDTTTTDSTGVAKNRWLLGDTVSGTQQVSASVEGLSPVFFQASGHEPLSVANAESLSAVMLDTLRVTLLAQDSLGRPHAGIPVQVGGITGFGEIVPGPTTTDVKGELLVRWVLGPSPGTQTFQANRADLNRMIKVEAEGTGELDVWPFTTVTTGVSHTCGIDEAGSAYCWGRGDGFRLGTGENESASAPVPVTSALSWTGISAGETHTCALGGAAAEIHCWGLGFQAGAEEAGQVIPTPSQVPGGPWTSLTAGEAHQCALAADGTAHCWGEALYGQLGNGSEEPTNDPTPVAGDHAWSQISAGRRHTCGVTTSGEPYCWGEGTAGQLGNGIREDADTPSLVAGGFQWRSVSAGWAHSCGITQEGEAFCWGAGSFNRLGNGATLDHTSPVRVAGNRSWNAISASERHSCGIDAEKKLYCWGAGGMVGLGLFGSATPALLAEEDDWESLQTLYRHTCAVTSDTWTYCWGANDYGQLGIRTTTASNVLRLVFRGVIRP